MDILYGVQGGGFGHCTRSQVVINELIRRGNRVKIVTTTKSAHRYLTRHFDDVHEVESYSYVYENGRVDRFRTVSTNIRRMPDMVRDKIIKFRNMLLDTDFRPNVALTDHESFSHRFAKACGIPVITVDNVQAIDRCLHFGKIPFYLRGNFRSTKEVVRASTPLSNHYFVVSFFDAPVRLRRRHNTSIVKPLIRDKILGVTPKYGDHIFVYNSYYEGIVNRLQKMPEKFIVYGFNRDENRGNVVLRRNHHPSFLNDLGDAKAVVSGGGFTLMTEALNLRKPIFSIPIERQFEQILNSIYVDRRGFGRFYDTEMSDVSLNTSLRKFINSHDKYIRNLRRYRPSDNRQTLNRIIEKVNLLRECSNCTLQLRDL